MFPSLTAEQAAQKQQRIESITVDPSEAHPNIVLLFADDPGYADIGCFGSNEIPKPYIDNLAARGVSFSNAYATAVTYNPLRAGMPAGRYQNII